MPPCPRCPCTAPNTVTVHGCTLPYPGVSVAVSQSGSPISGSPFTTDSLGKIAFTPPNQTHALTLVSTAPSARFAVTTTTVALVAGVLPATFTQDLNPATGYACIGCLLPAPKTLFLTDSAYQPCTLTWFSPSAGWSGITHVNTYPGFGACPAGTLTGIAYGITSLNLLAIVYCTVSGGTTGCPSGDIGGCTPTVRLTNAVGTNACAVPYSLTFVKTLETAKPLYPSGTTITITE